MSHCTDESKGNNNLKTQKLRTTILLDDWECIYTVDSKIYASYSSSRNLSRSTIHEIKLLAYIFILLIINGTLTNSSSRYLKLMSNIVILSTCTKVKSGIYSTAKDSRPYKLSSFLLSVSQLLTYDMNGLAGIQLLKETTWMVFDKHNADTWYVTRQVLWLK